MQGSEIYRLSMFFATQSAMLLRQNVSADEKSDASDATER